MRAITYVLKKNFEVKKVFCPPNDSLITFFKSNNIRYSEIKSKNKYLFDEFKKLEPGVVFSINNEYILHDNLLNLNHRFYNIHNGLIQKYRGIAELCILAAIINHEKEYGVTLHEILPGESIDSGPVVDQIKFNITDNTFESLIVRSHGVLEKIFENNLESILQNSYTSKYLETSDFVHSYKYIDTVLSNLSNDDIRQYCDLGRTAMFFPKLKAKLEEYDF